MSVSYQMRLKFKGLENENIGVFHPYAKFGNRIRTNIQKEIIRVKMYKTFCKYSYAY